MILLALALAGSARGSDLVEATEDPAALYTTYCASCHGAQGGGDGAVGRVLQPRPSAFADPAFWAARDDARIRTAILDGGPAVGASPVMAGWRGRLEERDVAALAAWLRERFSAQASVPP